MLVRFLSYLGKEGFGEQFLGEYELAGQLGSCTIRWAAEPRGNTGKDNPLARVRDAGALLQLYPDPVVPLVLAVVPCWNGLAVVSDAPKGTPFAEIEQRPLPEPVILEVVRQICAMLDRFYTRKDAHTGEMLRTMHRAISTECILLRPDGTLRVTGFEKMSTVWSARAAETSAMATHPGARLAPEQMAGEVFHATDVYLTGLVAVDLLVNPERASQTARMLAMCICDPEGFEEIREQILGDDTVEASTNLRGLLRAMLQEDPKSRPSAHIIANMAAAVGASESDLHAFAKAFPAPEDPEGLFHQFVGRTLELPDPQLRPFPSVGDDEEATDQGIEVEGAAPSADATAAQPEVEQPAPEAVPPPPAKPARPLIKERSKAVPPPPPPGVATVTPQTAKPAPREPEPTPEPEAEPIPTPAPTPEPSEQPPSEPDLPDPMPEPIKPSAAPAPAVVKPLADKPAPASIEPEPSIEPPAPAGDSDLAPAKKKSKLPLILGAVAVLFVLGIAACAAGGILIRVLL